jgi:hypothetical protein
MFKRIRVRETIAKVPADVLVIGKFNHPGAVGYFELPEFNIIGCHFHLFSQICTD